MLEKFLKTHPVIKWILCVLLSIVSSMAIAFSVYIGWLTYRFMSVFGFRMFTFLCLVVPVVSIIGATLMYRKFCNKYIDTEEQFVDTEEQFDED